MEQSRSDEAVGAVDSHSSDWHVVSAAQAAPLLVPDQFEPEAHGSQTRSEVEVPAVFSPWPAGQALHVVQSLAELLPAAANVPAAHAVHDDEPAGAHLPPPHWVQLPAPAVA